VRVTACDLASPTPNCGELAGYSFTVAGGAPEVPSATEGIVVPDGYWHGDPTRPLEVQNLPLSWTVRIFDTAGMQVPSYRNDASAGQDWAWDFTNDHGRRVVKALYLVRVTDSSGSVRQTGRFLVQTNQ
jgi:hypothetical protein